MCPQCGQCFHQEKSIQVHLKTHAVSWVSDNNSHYDNLVTLTTPQDRHTSLQGRPTSP